VILRNYQRHPEKEKGPDVPVTKDCADIGGDQGGGSHELIRFFWEKKENEEKRGGEPFPLGGGVSGRLVEFSRGGRESVRKLMRGK